MDLKSVKNGYINKKIKQNINYDYNVNKKLIRYFNIEFE